jgi:4'-phosphopantetheinyl transferase
MRVYWLEQAEQDVSESNDWLCAAEIARLNSLRFAKRRADWRLGRWTAKRAAAAYLKWPACPQGLAEIEIRATPSGAPDAIVTGLGSPMVVSLSHRAGRAMCVVSSLGVKLGCDLEMIEPRSEAFVADYFTPEEKSQVALTVLADRPEVVTLLWSAKESTLKALREGLRLDTRSVSVSFIQGGPDLSGWSPLRVRSCDGQVFRGWWRTADGMLRTVVSDPTPGCPICLGPAKPATPARTPSTSASGMTMKPEIDSIVGQ